MPRSPKGTGHGSRERERERDREERDSEFTDKLVHINRVAKVVKGGKRFGFAALVVVGDQKGRVGFGHGKAREVPEAIRKATEAAKRGLIRVAAARGSHAASRRARPPRRRQGDRCAPPRPVPASSPAARCAPCSKRSAWHDIVAKSMGSSNPYNMVRATFDALKNQDSPRSVAARRGLKVSVLQARRQERQATGDGVRTRIHGQESNRHHRADRFAASAARTSQRRDPRSA